MYCEHCGQKLEDGARFCSACGKPVVLADDVHADDVDGGVSATDSVSAAVAAASASNESTSTENVTFNAAMDSSHTRAKRKVSLVLLVALVALLLAAVAYAAHSAYRYYVEEVQTPITTVEEFTRALDEKDVEAAVACMDESTRNMYSTVFSLTDGALDALGIEQSSRSAFSQFVSDILPAFSALSGEYTDYHINIASSEQSVDGNRAHVSGEWHIQLISGGETVEQDEAFEFDLVLEWEGWRIVYEEPS